MLACIYFCGVVYVIVKKRYKLEVCGEREKDTSYGCGEREKDTSYGCGISYVKRE